MHIEAQKTTVLVIRLTLGEALAVLSDPAPLQKDIRARLRDKDTKHPRVGATRRVVHPKARPPRAGEDKVACPDCGKQLLPTSLWAHKKKMHSAAPAAA